LTISKNGSIVSLQNLLCQTTGGGFEDGCLWCFWGKDVIEGKDFVIISLSIDILEG
jgi:hypothetical protein